MLHLHSVHTIFDLDLHETAEWWPPTRFATRLRLCCCYSWSSAICHNHHHLNIALRDPSFCRIIPNRKAHGDSTLPQESTRTPFVLTPHTVMFFTAQVLYRSWGVFSTVLLVKKQQDSLCAKRLPSPHTTYLPSSCPTSFTKNKKNNHLLGVPTCFSARGRLSSCLSRIYRV